MPQSNRRRAKGTGRGRGRVQPQRFSVRIREKNLRTMEDVVNNRHHRDNDDNSNHNNRNQNNHNQQQNQNRNKRRRKRRGGRNNNDNNNNQNHNQNNAPMPNIDLSSENENANDDQNQAQREERYRRMLANKARVNKIIDDRNYKKKHLVAICKKNNLDHRGGAEAIKERIYWNFHVNMDVLMVQPQAPADHADDDENEDNDEEKNAGQDADDGQNNDEDDQMEDDEEQTMQEAIERLKKSRPKDQKLARDHVRKNHKILVDKIQTVLTELHSLLTELDVDQDTINKIMDQMELCSKLAQECEEGYRAVPRIKRGEYAAKAEFIHDRKARKVRFDNAWVSLIDQVCIMFQVCLRIH